MPRHSRLLTPKQVAEIFGMHPSSVTKWADDGKLPFVRTPGGQRRYRVEDVDDLYARTFGSAA